MNVYDFDGTIYEGDSSIDFYKFVLRKKPEIIRCSFRLIKGGLQYILKKADMTAFKECFFSFMKQIDGEKYVDLFWKEHTDKIGCWYRAQHEETDVIISASPAFLLKPICKALDIKYLIASDVDINTGEFRSANCKGEEKVRRFKKIFADKCIDNFYSDSESDLPLALEAEKAYYVHNGEIKEWEFENKQSSNNLLAGKIRKFFMHHKVLIKYVIFGVLTTLINAVVYACLYDRLGVSNVISTIIAWFLAVAFAFITNKISVFESKCFDINTLTHEVTSFLGARIFTGMIDIGIMYLTVDVLHSNAIIWKLISNIIVIALNFIASKLFIFRGNHHNHSNGK